MKLGDLVEWKGFGSITYDQKTGIIVKVVSIGGCLRYDVLWSDGSVGFRLFPHTINIIKNKK